MDKWQKAKNDEREYSGLLAEPLKKSVALAPRDDDDFRKIWDDKMAALFSHYDIRQNEPGAWVDLAMYLAIRHVPGFRVAKRKQGRPAKDSNKALTFFLHVELLKKRDNMSERKAVRAMFEKREQECSFDTMLTDYKRSKSKFLPLMQHIYRMTAHLSHETVIEALEGSLVEEI